MSGVNLHDSVSLQGMHRDNFTFTCYTMQYTLSNLMVVSGTVTVKDCKRCLSVSSFLLASNNFKTVEWIFIKCIFNPFQFWLKLDNKWHLTLTPTCVSVSICRVTEERSCQEWNIILIQLSPWMKCDFPETICTRITLGELDSILNLRFVAILFASRHSSSHTSSTTLRSWYQ